MPAVDVGQGLGLGSFIVGVVVKADGEDFIRVQKGRQEAGVNPFTKEGPDLNVGVAVKVNRFLQVFVDLLDCFFKGKVVVLVFGIPVLVRLHLAVLVFKPVTWLEAVDALEEGFLKVVVLVH